MLLTGTFGQYRALVPSVENGYFSRLLTVIIRGTNPFDKRYVSAKGEQSATPRIIGHRLLCTYESLLSAPEREWSLTDAQKERLGEHLETEYTTLIGLLGDNFHSAVIRMAIQIERIATILTALRIQNTEHRTPTELLCADEDYETAEVIGNRLLLHMAAAYRLIDGDAQDVVPEIKPIDQKQVLLNLLPEEFESKHLVAEAHSQGISRRTAIRWSDEWQSVGLIQKIKYGTYKKIA